MAPGRDSNPGRADLVAGTLTTRMFFLPWCLDLGRIQARVLEQVDKDGLILLEDDIAHGKVPLQLVDLVDEAALEVVHVGPAARLAEELDEWEGAGAEEAGQAHTVPLHHLLAHRLYRGPAGGDNKYGLADSGEIYVIVRPIFGQKTMKTIGGSRNKCIYGETKNLFFHIK